MGFSGRWSGVEALAHAINQPRHLVKLCGTADELRAALPAGWEIHASGYFMRATGKSGERPLAEGYSISVERVGAVSHAQIWSASGTLAASGYAAETPDAFIYDRIVTEREHRRKGLGHTLMMTLRAARRQRGAPELLVATHDGQALYSTLGWETISPYSTASIVAS